MRVKCSTIGICFAVLAMVAYFGSYLWVVQPVQTNLFLCWHGTPLRMDPHYRVSGPWVQALYEPLVRLDQQLFRERWQWEPPQEFQRWLMQSLTNMDLIQLHSNAVRGQVAAPWDDWREVAWAGVGADHRATPEEVARAKQRIHLVRSDMTDEQVFVALRLSHCYAYATGGGPTARLWVSYDILNGHGLRLVHDCTVGRKVRLTSVSLDDAVWKRDETRSR